MILICLAFAIDGDTIRCCAGPHIRVAGIEATELHGGCHLATCPATSGPDARAIMARLVNGKMLACEPLARSYRRVVASCTLPDGRDLRCAVEAAGGAVEWPSYVRRYRLPGCNRRGGSFLQ